MHINHKPKFNLNKEQVEFEFWIQNMTYRDIE